MLTASTDATSSSNESAATQENSQIDSCVSNSLPAAMAPAISDIRVAVEPIKVELPTTPPLRFYENGVFWTALAALLVSILSIYLTWNNNKKTRQRSIHDDFWVRKVLFDTAVGPLLSLVDFAADELPGINATDDDIQQFVEDFSIKHRSLATKLRLAKPVDQQLFDDLHTQYLCLEETVGNYTNIESPTVNERSEAQAVIADCAIQTVQILKNYQERLN